MCDHDPYTLIQFDRCGSLYRIDSHGYQMMHWTVFRSHIERCCPMLG